MAENNAESRHRTFVERVQNGERAFFEELEQEEAIERPIDADTSVVWCFYKDNPEWCSSITGFIPQLIHDLAVEITENTLERRGRMPALTVHDSLVVLMAIYRTNSTIPTLSANFKQKAA